MTDVAGRDMDSSLTAQEAWDLTMVERAFQATGQEMTPAEATAWYRADRAKREALQSQVVMRVTERARRTWVSFGEAEFDAVADLIAGFIETPEPQVWGHLDVLSRINAGPYDVIVVRTKTVLGMVEPSQPKLFALGLPHEPV